MKKTICFILLALNLVGFTSYASNVYTKCKNKNIKVCSIYQPPPYLSIHNYYHFF